MTEQNETNELIERIKKLEKTIVKLQKEARMGLEDQLFFGVIVALVVFLLELRPDELASFFQVVLMINYDVALIIADGVRNVALVFLIVAGAFRYYGAVSKQTTEKKYRLYSLQGLFVAWDFSLFVLIVNASFNVFIDLGPMSFPIATLILTVTYGLMFLFERKALRFFASQGLIFKKDVEPVISKIFMVLTAGFYLAFIVELVAIIRGMTFSTERFSIVWVLPLFLFALLSAIASRRKKKRKKTKKKTR